MNKLDLKKERQAGKWSVYEQKIVAQLYPTGGADACMPYLPNRIKTAIAAWASKHGYRYKPQKYQAYHVGETASSPDAPRRYQAEWKPLKPVHGLPRRSGADDWRALPSVK